MDKKTQKEILDIVRRNYGEIAEHYNETRKKHFSSLWDELKKICDSVEDWQSVLDVGCGNGRLLELFKDRKVNYLGIDSSKELIGFAKKRFPGYKFIEGNILDLGEAKEINFDYAFSIAVLHHLPGEELRVQALRQLKNKVKKDGRIVITVWAMWSQEKYRKKIIKFILLKLIGKNKMDIGDILFDWKNSQGETVSKRYYHAFRKSELKRIARKAGLKVEKIYKDKFNYYLIIKKFQ